MGSFYASILSLIARFLPSDMFLADRYMAARLMAISFLCGFCFAFPCAVLFKIAVQALRRRWNAFRRDRRIAQIKVPNGEYVGEVTNYLSRARVAIIKVRSRGLVQGDVLLIKGKSTKLMVPVKSMQIDHKPVVQAKRGSEIGLLTGKPVSRRDLVFKMRGQR